MARRGGAGQWVPLRLLAVTLAAGLSLSGAVVYRATSAAFVASTSSAPSWSSGTVVLTDNDGGAATFTAAGMLPGSVETRCLTVSYGGSLGAQVRFFATTTGTGLAAYLDLKITRGRFATVPAHPACTGFTPDPVQYLPTQGVGVMYLGTLAGLPANHGAGLVDPYLATPEVWTLGESHTYMIEVSVREDATAQNLTATSSFVWEARDASAPGSGSYYAQAVLADQPVGLWRLDEASGTSAAPAAGPVTGTYQGGVTLAARGPVPDNHGAAVFDGVDDQVSLGDVHDFAGLSPFSLEMWTDLASVNEDYPVLVGKLTPGSPTQGWSLLVLPGTHNLQFQRWRDGANQIATTGPVSTGWHHIAAVFDGTNMTIYMDGAVAATSWNAAVSVLDGSNAVHFGSRAGVGNWYRGGLANVAIYNRGLTAAEVQSHYNARN